MSKIKGIYFLLLLSFSIHGVYAQNTCNSRLKQARELYETGQIERIPDLLDSCLVQGFTNNEKSQAYLLLIQTYLFDYNREKAMEVMLKFLRKYPEYKFSAASPVEIREIFDSYKVRPDWGFGFTAESNFSQVSSSQLFTVFNTNTFNTSYQAKIGFRGGVYIEKFFGHHLGVSLDLSFKTLSYENKESDNLKVSNSTIIEQSQWISLPVRINYCFGNGKFSPMLFGGAELSYLNNTKGDLKYLINSEAGIFVNSTSVDLTKSRNSIQYSVLAGLGVRYKIPKGYIKLGIGYNYSISDYINGSKRFDNPDIVLNYGHIDDDLILNNVFVTISYSRNIFRIKVKDKDE